MKYLIWVLSIAILFFAPGCIVHLHGTGEAGIGLRNDNMLVMYHKAAPSAENPEGDATAETSITPLVNNLIDLRKSEEKEDVE